MKFEYDKTVFDEEQRDLINQAMLFGASKEILSVMTSLNNNGDPIFSKDQTATIVIMLSNGNTPSKIINMIIKVENNVPIFSTSEMGYISGFLNYADDKQLQQFKECLEEGMRFDDFAPFLNHYIPSECMRIYKSLHFLGCNKDNIQHIINSKTSYEDLKTIKYLLTCGKVFDIKINALFNKDSIDTESLIDNLIYKICTKCSNMGNYSQSRNIVSKCLSVKMDPEQIQFTMDPFNEFSIEDKKNVAIGFLNGATIEEIEKCMSEPGISLKSAINNLINQKISNIYNLDEEVEIKTDYFDEIEDR